MSSGSREGLKTSLEETVAVLKVSYGSHRGDTAAARKMRCYSLDEPKVSYEESAGDETAVALEIALYAHE